MVDFTKDDFIGKDALQSCDKRQRTWGLRVPGGEALVGHALTNADGFPAGQVCSSAWSPLQQCGVAIVRLEDPKLGPDTDLHVTCVDSVVRAAKTCNLPMYDPDRLIPRGKAVDIPDLPNDNKADLGYIGAR
jgi:aminomethyltransferase